MIDPWSSNFLPRSGTRPNMGLLPKMEQKWPVFLSTNWLWRGQDPMQIFFLKRDIGTPSKTTLHSKWAVSAHCLTVIRSHFRCSKTKLEDSSTESNGPLIIFFGYWCWLSRFLSLRRIFEIRAIDCSSQVWSGFSLFWTKGKSRDGC